MDEERKSVGAVGSILPLTTISLILHTFCPAEAQISQSPAVAPQTLAAVRSVGLLGTWAVSCRTGPTPSNPFVTFYATGKGEARRRIERGTEMSLDGAIDSAQRVGSNRISMRLRNDDQNWQARNGEAVDAVFAVSRTKLQAVTVLGADNTAIIKQAHLLATGADSATLERCSR